MEVVYSQESILAGDGDVMCVGGESKPVYCSMSDRPSKENRRLALRFGRADLCVGDVSVKNKSLYATVLSSEATVPYVEVATSVRRDKLVVVSWYPLDTGHSCAVYGTLCTMHVYSDCGRNNNR